MISCEGGRDGWESWLGGLGLSGGFMCSKIKTTSWSLAWNEWELGGGASLDFKAGFIYVVR